MCSEFYSVPSRRYMFENWTLDDLIDANIVLDMKDDLKRAEANATRPKPAKAK